MSWTESKPERGIRKPGCRFLTSWHRTIGRSLTLSTLKLSWATWVHWQMFYFLHRSVWEPNKQALDKTLEKNSTWFSSLFSSHFLLDFSRSLAPPTSLPFWVSFTLSLPVIALLPLAYPFILWSLIFSSFYSRFIFSLSLVSVSVDSGNVNKRIPYHFTLTVKKRKDRTRLI